MGINLTSDWGTISLGNSAISWRNQSRSFHLYFGRAAWIAIGGKEQGIRLRWVIDTGSLKREQVSPEQRSFVRYNNGKWNFYSKGA